MKIHAQVQQEIETILRSWDGQRFYWIHLKGDTGAGTSTLLKNIVEHTREFAFPIVRVSAPVWLGYEDDVARWFVQKLFSPVEESQSTFEQLPAVYRQWVAATLKSVEKKRGNFSTQLQKDFRYLLRWGLRHFPVIFILDDMDPLTTHGAFRRWQPWFEVFRQRNVLFFTAGHRVPRFNDRHPDYVFTLPGITMKGAITFLQQKYQVPELIARMMVNQLYLKSEGNLQKLHWLARTFFGDVLTLPPKKMKPELFQRKVQQPGSPQILLKAIMEQLTLPQQQILGFFSRLDVPLLKKHTDSILKQAGFSRKDVQFLVNEHFLETETLNNQPLYFLKNSPLKEFLKQHVTSELLLPFQDSLRELVQRNNWNIAAGFYRVLLDGGFLNGAVEVAYYEARVLAKVHQWERAREFLHFLRRNLSNSVLSPSQRLDVLRWLAHLYDASGLTENYFEMLREYRDHLTQKDAREYLHVSLEMADALLRMDALGEARYFLREARAKKVADPGVRFQAKLLSGDLERYLGHPEYAYHQYHEALTLLERVKDAPQKVWGLYRRFKAIQEEGVAIPDWERIVETLLPIARRNPEVYVRIQLERIRARMQESNYLEALWIAITTYRQSRWHVFPDTLQSLDKLLGELYGAVGKWTLAAYHLRRALHTVEFAADAALPDDVRIALGVVYKETARYRDALEVFQQVHEDAGLRNDFSRFVEAKLHLAHVHILTHNKFKALDYIRSSLRMEDSLRDATLMLTAKLLALSLEIQQRNWTRAATLLEDARQLAWQTENPLDVLNLQFYEIQYALGSGTIDQLPQLLETFTEKSAGLTKFTILAHWLRGKWLARQHHYQNAMDELRAALQCAHRYGMVHLAFQIVLDILELPPKYVDVKLPAAEEIYNQLMSAIGDEILRRQIQESDEGERWINILKPEKNHQEERGGHVH